MDNSFFRRQGSDTQQPSGFLASLQIFEQHPDIGWLVSFS